MKLPKSAVLLLFALLFLSFIRPETSEHFKDIRDGEVYDIVRIRNLKWFKENLRYRSEPKMDTMIPIGKCGVFYAFDDAQKACPKGWRLPTKEEVKDLIKENKKNKINLTDTLEIELCGRIDNEKHTKYGLQNTFWLNEDLEKGHVAHWHTFSSENKIHSHNVINARRKFPVRCVREID